MKTGKLVWAVKLECRRQNVRESFQEKKIVRRLMLRNAVERYRRRCGKLE